MARQWPVGHQLQKVIFIREKATRMKLLFRVVSEDEWTLLCVVRDYHDVWDPYLEDEKH